MGMRGKQVLMDTLVAHGVEYIFGNPGTTESPLMDGLAGHPRLRYIVALHEGVALGAAAYYAHASGRTAFVNLHVAPGLGNALGMLLYWFAAERRLVAATNLRLCFPEMPEAERRRARDRLEDGIQRLPHGG